MTRLADQGGVRAWRVESRGNHLASCYKSSGNTQVLVSSHLLPFHMKVVEVLAPAGGW